MDDANIPVILEHDTTEVVPDETTAHAERRERRYGNMVAWMTLMEMASRLSSRSAGIDTLSEDQGLRRHEEQQVNVSEQRYDTVPQPEVWCNICSQDYIATDVVSLLECTHLFHTKCIREWAHYKPDCPLCRTKIPVVESS